MFSKLFASDFENMLQTKLSFNKQKRIVSAKSVTMRATALCIVNNYPMTKNKPIHHVED